MQETIVEPCESCDVHSNCAEHSEIEEWQDIHPLLHPHMDNHMFSDDQICEIDDMLKKAAEEGRKEGDEGGMRYILNEVYVEMKEEAVKQYKEELLGRLPDERDILGDIKGYTVVKERNIGFNECLLAVKKLL
jgi:hypothetical protein